MSIQELITATQISRATLTRLLQTLEHEEYVMLQPGGYELTYRIWSLGSEFLASHPVRKVAFPHLAKLAGQTNLAVNLFILDGQSTVHIETLIADSTGALKSELGFTRIPALLNASGRAILAYHPDERWSEILENTRLGVTPKTLSAEEITDALRAIPGRGYATIDGEYFVEQAGIASPVFTGWERYPTAAVSIGWTGGLDEHLNEELVATLISSTRSISESLGFHERVSKLV